MKFKRKLKKLETKNFHVNQKFYALESNTMGPKHSFKIGTTFL